MFTLEQMRTANTKSMYLDGIEKIKKGALYYTDELIQKAERAFGAKLPKYVPYEDIDSVAKFIIEEIIEPQLKI